jgi:hypothetical protein
MRNPLRKTYTRRRIAADSERLNDDLTTKVAI